MHMCKMNDFLHLFLLCFCSVLCTCQEEFSSSYISSVFSIDGQDHTLSLNLQMKANGFIHGNLRVMRGKEIVTFSNVSGRRYADNSASLWENISAGQVEESLRFSQFKWFLIENVHKDKTMLNWNSADRSRTYTDKMRVKLTRLPILSKT